MKWISKHQNWPAKSHFLNFLKYGEWEDFKNRKGNYQSIENNEAHFDSSRPGRPEIRKKFEKGEKITSWL